VPALEPSVFLHCFHCVAKHRKVWIGVSQQQHAAAMSAVHVVNATTWRRFIHGFARAKNGLLLRTKIGTLQA
jgi:hypothetical protein